MALQRLADGSPLGGALKIGLREQFLDDEPADHAAAFVGVYGRLALPGLDAEATERAVALLEIATWTSQWP